MNLWHYMRIRLWSLEWKETQRKKFEFVFAGRRGRERESGKEMEIAKVDDLLIDGNVDEAPVKATQCECD